MARSGCFGQSRSGLARGGDEGCAVGGSTAPARLPRAARHSRSQAWLAAQSSG
ncbi:hypothetical protein GLAREA_00031 [Glarea lozoyensis ATCC 20868]|uniref:Uncharacterized protein n=1 Tax=Glarea lozoyensis (strain ATCC 20868 / MF5171) TaxID=1116229 RepID=S3DQY7_GLAL2|nr:uncharacterized protein GLAREA_00031 [Glarea lozoyensis ATCC 20868]EPE28873.1 hypothetical protein GLAREA_00031 [Glarea lozoyensis ATCC 20868]